jgi:hypothetical protein
VLELHASGNRFTVCHDSNSSATSGVKARKPRVGPVLEERAIRASS